MPVNELLPEYSEAQRSSQISWQAGVLSEWESDAFPVNKVMSATRWKKHRRTEHVQSTSCAISVVSTRTCLRGDY